MNRTSVLCDLRQDKMHFWQLRKFSWQKRQAQPCPPQILSVQAQTPPNPECQSWSVPAVEVALQKKFELVRMRRPSSCSEWFVTNTREVFNSQSPFSRLEVSCVSWSFQKVRSQESKICREGHNFRSWCVCPKASWSSFWENFSSAKSLDSILLRSPQSRKSAESAPFPEVSAVAAVAQWEAFPSPAAMLFTVQSVPGIKQRKLALSWIMASWSWLTTSQLGMRKGAESRGHVTCEDAPCRFAAGFSRPLGQSDVSLPWNPVSKRGVWLLSHRGCSCQAFLRISLAEVSCLLVQVFFFSPCLKLKFTSPHKGCGLLLPGLYPCKSASVSKRKSF